MHKTRPYFIVATGWGRGVWYWDWAIIRWAEFRAALQRAQNDKKCWGANWQRYNAPYSNGRWIIRFKPLPKGAFGLDQWLQKCHLACDSSANESQNYFRFSMARPQRLSHWTLDRITRCVTRWVARTMTFLEPLVHSKCALKKGFETNYSSPLTVRRVITLSIRTPKFFVILSAL